MGVGPGACAVAVEFGPVVVPGFGAVVGFGDVVVAFAVAAGEDEFVVCAGRFGGVEVANVVGETLPLRECDVFWRVGIVGPVYKAEIMLALIPVLSAFAL